VLFAGRRKNSEGFVPSLLTLNTKKQKNKKQKKQLSRFEPGSSSAARFTRPLHRSRGLAREGTFAVVGIKRQVPIRALCTFVTGALSS